MGDITEAEAKTFIAARHAGDEETQERIWEKAFGKRRATPTQEDGYIRGYEILGAALIRRDDLLREAVLRLKNWIDEGDPLIVRIEAEITK